jgi:hypothetical protein
MILVLPAKYVFLDHLKGPRLGKDKTTEKFGATKLTSFTAENAAL